jgi:drug/metabolite transporter (DMT)-like permease
VKRAHGVGLLVLTTLIWGTTFPSIKVATAYLTPGQIVASRFAVALLALAWFLRKATRLTWWHGLLTGSLAAISFLSLALGMKTTGSARSGFLIGLNVILVPLAMPFLGKRLTPGAVIGAVLAAAGMAALAWDASVLSFSPGDWWVVLSAASFAAYILVMDRCVALHDSRAFTAAQISCVLVIALLFSAKQGDHWPALHGPWPWVILYLGLVATAFAIWLQVKGQQVVTPVQAAIIYSLEPVFAAAFSALLLHERLRAQDLLGGALIVSGMIVCMLPQRTQG